MNFNATNNQSPFPHDDDLSTRFNRFVEQQKRGEESNKNNPHPTSQGRNLANIPANAELSLGEKEILSLLNKFIKNDSARNAFINSQQIKNTALEKFTYDKNDFKQMGEFINDKRKLTLKLSPAYVESKGYKQVLKNIFWINNFINQGASEEPELENSEKLKKIIPNYVIKSYPDRNATVNNITEINNLKPGFEIINIENKPVLKAEDQTPQNLINEAPKGQLIPALIGIPNKSEYLNDFTNDEKDYFQKASTRYREHPSNNHEIVPITVLKPALLPDDSYIAVSDFLKHEGKITSYLDIIGYGDNRKELTDALGIPLDRELSIIQAQDISPGIDVTSNNNDKNYFNMALQSPVFKAIRGILDLRRVEDENSDYNGKLYIYGMHPQDMPTLPKLTTEAMSVDGLIHHGRANGVFYGQNPLDNGAIRPIFAPRRNQS